MWAVLVGLAIGYVIRYSKRIRHSPAQIGRRHLGDGRRRTRADDTDVPALTGRQKFVLVLFGGTFLTMIYGFIPWNDLWQEGFGRTSRCRRSHDFYFPEAVASSSSWRS